MSLIDSSETLKYQNLKEVEKGGNLHLKTVAANAYGGMKDGILSSKQFKT